MWSVAARPRWIATLALALAVAAGFAALGQWQLARSIAAGEVIRRDTETVRPLDELAHPQQGVTETQDGQSVRVTGQYVPGDFSLLAERLNGGESGYWVVGHLATNGPAGGAALAVAVGWAPTEAEASSALSSLDAAAPAPIGVSGRYVAPEAPQLTDFENGRRTVMSPAALVNQWRGFTGAAYAGYVVSAAEVPGLQRIDAPQPVAERGLNLLNLFYAAEWAVFAVFAVFLWYRLVKDAWEREVEEAELAEAERDARTELARMPRAGEQHDPAGEREARAHPGAEERR